MTVYIPLPSLHDVLVFGAGLSLGLVLLMVAVHAVAPRIWR